MTPAEILETIEMINDAPVGEPLFRRADLVIMCAPVRGTGRAPIDPLFDVACQETTCDCGDEVVAPGESTECRVCDCGTHYLTEDGHLCELDGNSDW